MPTEQILKLLHQCNPVDQSVARSKFDKEINITVWARITSRYRTKDADVISTMPLGKHENVIMFFVKQIV